MRTNKRDPFHLSTEQLKCKMWPQSRSPQSSAIIFTPFSNFDQIRDSSPDMCSRLRNGSQDLLTPLWCDCKALFNWIFVTKRKSPKNIELNCQTDGVCHLAWLFSNNGTTLFLPQAFYGCVIKQTFVTPTFAYESVSCILNVCIQSWFAFLFIWNMKLVGIPRLVFLSFGLFYCLPFSVGPLHVWFNSDYWDFFLSIQHVGPLELELELGKKERHVANCGCGGCWSMLGLQGVLRNIL